MIARLIGLILLINGFAYTGFCQGQIIDSALIKTKFSVLYRPDSTNPARINEDIFVLEVGDNYSKYYSYYRWLSDSIIASHNNELTGIDAQAAAESLKGAPMGSTKTILRNLSTNVFTITSSLGLNNYRYLDSIKTFKWVITPDTATISTYSCKKATTSFRGRKYEVWFTTQVPISIGPSLFCGLPGMIVKIKDLKGDFEFNLISFELLKTRFPIYMDNKKITMVSRTQYRKLVAQMYNDMDGFALSQGMIFKTRSINGVTSPAPTPTKIPYNPMELE